MHPVQTWRCTQFVVPLVRCRSGLLDHCIRHVSNLVDFHAIHVDQKTVMDLEAHACPSANGHYTGNCAGVKQFPYRKLPALYVQHVRYQISFADNEKCILFNHGDVSNSSFLSSYVDPVYLITCIRHVSIPVDFHAIPVHQKTVILLEAHVCPSGNGHYTDNCAGFKHFLYRKLPTLHVQHVRYQISFAVKVNCILFNRTICPIRSPSRPM